MVRVQQPGTRSSTDRSPSATPDDMWFLLNIRRRTPTRPSLFNLERPSLVDSTVPVATPAPIPHYTPAATPPSTAQGRRIIDLQRRVTGIWRTIPRELTVKQRRFVGRIPEPEAVVSIAPGVAGSSNWPEDVRGGGTAFWIAGFLTGKPRTRYTEIPLTTQAWEVPAAVRHEAAHHVLGAQGVPKSEHEVIIAQARIPGTISGVNFGLLQMLIESYKVPSATQRRRFDRRLMQLTLRELRRGSR